jgi:hypothetical protein
MKIMERNWDFYYREGVGFYKRAYRSYMGEATVFSNELLFNLLSMSMERLLISLLLYHHTMPASETVSGLMRECKNKVTWHDEMYAEVRWLNRFVHLCSLDPTPMKVPDDSEMVKVFKIAELLIQKVTSELYAEAISS